MGAWMRLGWGLTIAILVAGCGKGPAPQTNALLRCQADATVACSGLHKGYLCPPNDDPARELHNISYSTSGSCTAGATRKDGNVEFCCTECDLVHDAGCAYSSYVCTGADAPTRDLFDAQCFAPTSLPDGSRQYCCIEQDYPSDANCYTVDSGCPAGYGAYDCVDGLSPLSNAQNGSNIICGPGTKMGSYDDIYGYCCAGGANSCVASTVPTVFGCPAAGLGYLCSGIDRPEAANVNIVCGTGVSVSDGNTDYCCAQMATGAGGCQRATPDGCVGIGLIGLACTGGQTPQDLSQHLRCTEGRHSLDDTSDTLYYCCTPQ